MVAIDWTDSDTAGEAVSSRRMIMMLLIRMLRILIIGRPNQSGRFLIKTRGCGGRHSNAATADDFVTASRAAAA